MADDAAWMETDGHVAIVHLNRPAARNALDPRMLVELADCWRRVRDDADIRIAIVTGTGGAFCSGADLGRFIPLVSGGRPPEDDWDRRVLADRDILGTALLRTFDVVKPVIAAINGHAIAGGMELVQGTDLRIASSAARFGVQEVKWAIFPGGGSTVRLPRQLPYARAMELLLTGDLIDADTALEYGFLNRVVAPEEVLPAALDLARRIAANGPIAVQAIRASARACLGRPESEGMDLESGFAAPVFRTEDAREGPRAFIEKRTPVFRGR
jgi:enoyl-CoA hydratase